MRGFDYDRFLRGAAEPILATPIYRENDEYVASIFAHDGVRARCIEVKSDSRDLCDELRNDMIFNLMLRDANITIYSTRKELQQAAKCLWPANVLAWIRSDVEKTHERNRALSKSSK